jgi:DNA-binding NarL/FixJ family response regulator
LGLNSGEIAERLIVDRSTVQRYLAEAMIALRAASKLEAIVRAIQLGLIVLPMSEHPGSPMSAVCPRSA